MKDRNQKWIEEHLGDPDDDRLTRIEQKLDDMKEMVDLLGRLLVRSHDAGKRLGLSKDTLSQNDKVTKYEEVGHRRTYVEVGDLRVVKKRRKKR